MNFDGAECLERIQQLPGLEVEVIPESDNGSGRADFRLRLISDAGETQYWAEVKNSVTTKGVAVLLGQLRAYAEHARVPLLLAPYISAAVAEELRAEQQEYVDAVGNMYLRGPAIYAYVEGKKDAAFAATNLTVTDLKATLAIVADPGIIRRGYRAIAGVSHASVGAVSKAVNKLERLGYLHRRSRQRISIIEPRQLVERWELGYAEQLRMKLDPSYWKPLPGVKLPDLVKQGVKMEGVRLGGEHAAAAMLPSLFTPGTITFHAPPGVSKKVAAGLRLARSNEGDQVVTILEGPEFGDYKGQPVDNLVDPVLVRAELLHLRDSRLRAVADRLLQERILPRFDRA